MSNITIPDFKSKTTTVGEFKHSSTVVSVMDSPNTEVSFNNNITQIVNQFNYKFKKLFQNKLGWFVEFLGIGEASIGTSFKVK